MNCSISGQTPQRPVLSLKSRQVFEKHLLEKAVSATGADPVTGEPMTLDDIVPISPVNPAVTPRPDEASSLPRILTLLQSDWDAATLETFQLRQQLQSTRQQLTHALYQYDAAARVIAQLIRERDEARFMLASAEANLRKAIGTAGGEEASTDVDMDGGKNSHDFQEISTEKMDFIKSLSSSLMKGRKQLWKSRASEVVSRGDLEKYQEKTSVPLFSEGVSCMDTSVDCDLVFTGSDKGNCALYRVSSGDVVSTMAAHSGPVRDVALQNELLGDLEGFVPTGLLFSCGDDRTVKAWLPSDREGYTSRTFSQHSEAVTALSLHPSGRFFASASLDKTWSLYDIETLSIHRQVSDPKVTHGYTALEVHPDGNLVLGGTQGNLIPVWDLRTTSLLVTLPTKIPVSSLSICGNGYYVASGGVDGSVTLWDLRKQVEFRSFQLDTPAGAAAEVRFNGSGHYLAVSGGSRVQVHDVKKWDTVRTLELPFSTSGAMLSELGEYLAVSGSDGRLLLYGN